MTPLIDFIGVINPDSLKVTPKINVLTIEEIEISIPHCNFSEENRSLLYKCHLDSPIQITPFILHQFSF